MHSDIKDQSIIQVLADMLSAHPTDNITIGELVHNFREKGFALLMLVLVLPNCVPIPVPPGVSTVFSIPLLFLSVQMLFGSGQIWLPKWLDKKKVSRKFLTKVVTVIGPKIRWVERILRPRFRAISTKRGEQVVGFFWVVFAISIAVPLPWTNFIPGIGILVSALGFMRRDGLVVIAGFLIGMVGIAATCAILFFGFEAVSSILGLGA